MRRWLCCSSLDPEGGAGDTRGAHTCTSPSTFLAWYRPDKEKWRGEFLSRRKGLDGQSNCWVLGSTKSSYFLPVFGKVGNFVQIFWSSSFLSDLPKVFIRFPPCGLGTWPHSVGSKNWLEASCVFTPLLGGHYQIKKNTWSNFQVTFVLGAKKKEKTRPRTRGINRLLHLRPPGPPTNDTLLFLF